MDSVRSIGDHVRMTVIDERARVPAPDAAALERLRGALDRDGVVAAMLIGSQARGNAGPLSDIDVGIWHEPGLDPSTRLSLHLALASAAARALGTDEVDVVMLNRASPLLRHRAIRDARRLVERDPKARVRFEAKALLDYLDTKPLRDELAHGLRRSIEEDRFGRPREH
jgi:predicted nucleotidyltransferase